jgi:hypothetical protein
MDKELEQDLTKLLQDTGDRIVGVLDQMIIGGWVDDNGHFVYQNREMQRLADQLTPIMDFRTKYFWYKDMKGDAK